MNGKISQWKTRSVMPSECFQEMSFWFFFPFNERFDFWIQFTESDNYPKLCKVYFLGFLNPGSIYPQTQCSGHVSHVSQNLGVLQLKTSPSELGGLCVLGVSRIQIIRILGSQNPDPFDLGYMANRCSLILNMPSASLGHLLKCKFLGIVCVCVFTCAWVCAYGGYQTAFKRDF